MAFTTTLLSWSVIEFGSSMHSQLENAKAAVKWGSDYLLKAYTATPDSLYVQVSNTFSFFLLRIQESGIVLIPGSENRLEIRTGIIVVGKDLKIWTHLELCIKCLHKIQVLM